MKRGRLEIIKDILDIIKSNHGEIRFTPLLRKSGLSSAGFKDYYKELLEREFIYESLGKNSKCVKITQRGYKFIDKYSVISGFIEEFEL
jgi:predicted transcriptional regulator